MSEIPPEFSPASLYLAGFAQARAPHVGLIIPTSEKAGCLVHIRIDRAVADEWTYQCRNQKIEGEMTLTSLYKLRDAVTKNKVTPEQLQEIAATVPVPQNDNFGECTSWTKSVVEKLADAGLIQVTDMEGLWKEFEEFVTGNRAFARRDRFPNVVSSSFCS
ncbi:hypothetical protein K474DRAFT_1691801 [Panus rudis PR-1116 ss-1]|nr:hypothetical protein K474DRAFT_1691801 [Panus rudis PR-1116 ss-1]